MEEEEEEEEKAIQLVQLGKFLILLSREQPGG